MRGPVNTMTVDEYHAAVGSEASWQLEIKDMATQRGWVILMEIPDYGLAGLGALIGRAKKGGISRFPMKALLTLLSAISGWPDLTLGHSGRKRIVFVEVKDAGKNPRPNQKAMIALLQACGQEVYVWRPNDRPKALAVLGG